MIPVSVLRYGGGQCLPKSELPRMRHNLLSLLRGASSSYMFTGGAAHCFAVQPLLTKLPVLDPAATYVAITAVFESDEQPVVSFALDFDSRSLGKFC